MSTLELEPFFMQWERARVSGLPRGRVIPIDPPAETWQSRYWRGDCVTNGRWLVRVINGVADDSEAWKRLRCLQCHYSQTDDVELMTRQGAVFGLNQFYPNDMKYGRYMRPPTFWGRSADKSAIAVGWQFGWGFWFISQLYYDWITESLGLRIGVPLGIHVPVGLYSRKTEDVIGVVAAFDMNKLAEVYRRLKDDEE